MNPHPHSPGCRHLHRRAFLADLGMGFTGLALAAMLHRGPEAAVALARFAARHAGQGVYAFGLTGDEVAYASEPFAEAFSIARDAGLAAAPHAGELSGPPSVRAAVDLQRGSHDD